MSPTTTAVLVNLLLVATALGAAFFAEQFLKGALQLKNKWLRATGSIAVFILAWWMLQQGISRPEIGGSHVELAQRGAQLADATAAARAEIGAGLKERERLPRKASAQAHRQLAAKKDQLRELDRQLAAARSETQDMRQRLDAAYAELERERAENNRLAADLAAVRMTLNSPTIMAQGNLTAIEDQISTFHASGGATPLEGPEQPAEPFPKPRLKPGEGDGRAPASDRDDDVAWPRAETVAPIEGDALIEASFLDGAISNGVPTTDHTASRTRLNEAAARLANGLRVARDEAMSQRQERVFTLDVEERAFATEPTAELVPLDPALNIHLLTVKSERVGESRAGIRFFADGSSTGGRIELKLLGDRVAINVQWATGAVTVER